MGSRIILFLVIIFLNNTLFAQESDKIVTEFSGFLETFYSYNSAEPSNQASLPFLYNYNRHNEFNVNIALLKGSFTIKIYMQK